MVTRRRLDMKRGIIHLREIGIEFSGKDFEYDVYNLVRAFYPASNVQMSYAGEECDKAFELFIRLQYESDSISLQITQDDKAASSETIKLDYYANRKDTKNQLKRLLYRGLASISGKDLPWGTLTGIRPTKLPMRLLENGMSNQEIANFMRETYYCSNEKTALSIAIVNQEADILKDFDYKNGYSLYVGIPFCPSICLYCSFGSHPIKQYEAQVEEYLLALFREIDFVSQVFANKRLDTIYIGGGTPTTLTVDQLKRLLSHICQRVDTSQLQEFTVEAGRPDSITVEKLKVIADFGVTRISINPQTMNQETLDIIGRKHTVEEVEGAFKLARHMGFDNINMDLIVGLPGEDATMVDDTLEQIKSLNPDSLTIHSLALKRATRLTLFKDEYESISFENSQAIMDKASKCATDCQTRPYYLYRQKNIAGNFENVGYAKPAKAGIYNILIMEEKQTIMALGAGAATKIVFDDGLRVERVENVKDVQAYISRIDEMIERKRIGIEKWLK